MFRPMWHLQQLMKFNAFSSHGFHNHSLSYPEALKALRPLWFAAHPDFFCHSPEKQRTNEKSLQALNNYLQEVQRGHSPTALYLQFYLRQTGQETVSKSIQIHLQESQLSPLVRSLLHACGFPPLKEVEGKSQSSNSPRVEIHFYGEAKDNSFPRTSAPHVKQFPLHKWLKKALIEADQIQKKWKVVDQDTEKLKDRLMYELNLQEISWHSDYSLLIQRSSLQSLAQVLDDKRYSDAYRKLQISNSGLRLIFCDQSGLSCFGDVLLDVMRVPHDWIRTLHTLPPTESRQELFLKTQTLETGLSDSLGGLQVIRCKDFHETTSLSEYHYWMQLLSQKLIQESKLNITLFEYDSLLPNVVAVIDDRFSEPTISEKGIVVIPIHSPAFLALAFLRNVWPAVQETRRLYSQQRLHLDYLAEACKSTFNAKSMHFHPRLTISQNTAFCEKLLTCGPEVNFNQCNVMVDTGYCVGPHYELHIPWNWELHNY